MEKINLDRYKINFKYLNINPDTLPGSRKKLNDHTQLKIKFKLNLFISVSYNPFINEEKVELVKYMPKCKMTKHP